jgi:hypothetical protein
MNVIAAARALNQKAVQQNWHHFCDPTLAFTDPRYAQLLSLWRTKAGDRNMPSRSDITPRDLKDILRHVLIFERISQNPSRFRWRLVGTGLTDLSGDVTGKTFEETIPPEHLARWVECGDLILDGGQPLRFLGRVHIQEREYLEAENLYVPLANDNGVPSFILGLCHHTPRDFNGGNSWENQLASMPGGLL